MTDSEKKYGQGRAGNKQKQIPPTPFEKKGGRQGANFMPLETKLGIQNSSEKVG